MTKFTPEDTMTGHAIDAVLMLVRELHEEVGYAHRVAVSEGDADAAASLLDAANTLTALSCRL